MEGGLLSDSKLARFYDQVVWMYLFQDFSHSEADRGAERVAIRFGISSWPQHFLVDPYTLDVVADTGRSLKSFGAAVARTNVKRRADGIRPRDLAKRDALARSFEQSDSVAAAREHLLHEDVVVRCRAVERLRQADPKAIVKAAEPLLATPHDQIRYAVCQEVAKSLAKPEGVIVAALESIVRTPVGSKNPNVLRIQAVQALARCGTGDSVKVIAPWAMTGHYHNGLTRIAVSALVDIAGRDEKARKRVVDHLLSAFPLVKVEFSERELRACVALARHVHRSLETVTGKKVEFPGDYTSETRQELQDAWLMRAATLR